MSGQCVIGLQWGDEAKGKLVDWLTSGKDMVVRYQGGANAGHTVVIGEEVYKLHHIPSGILNSGVKNLVTAGVVIHPPTILGEMDMLLERGNELAGRLFLSDRAHIVMPWHLKEDALWNKAISGDDNIGTTLRGIGPCYRDKVGRSHAIRLGDLIQPSFPDRVKNIVAVKQKTLAGIADGVDLELDADKIIAEFTGYADRLRPYVIDTTRMLLDAVDEGKKLLFEGAQGSLLDIDHGTFPFVTSSNSSGVGISAGSGVPAKWIGETIGVCKSYSTRVGGGPFPTELENETGEHIRKIGKEFGTTTGRPRRCGWFDAVAVRYTSRLSGIDGIALTMLDVLSELPELEICTAYELDGERIEYFPGIIEELKRVKPVYEQIAGWQQDITGARNFSDLPAGAVAFAARIQELVGFPIKYISVGPDREQTIIAEDSALLKSAGSASVS